MKKILISTTALVAAAHAVSPAMAAGPDVSIGGHINFIASQADSDSSFSVSGGTIDFSRDTHFTNDTEIVINVDGKADNGLGYGAVIELEADVDGGAENNGPNGGTGNADKTYIYLESAQGRVELGDNVGAGQSLSVGASNIAAGTGGIKGEFHEYVNVGQRGDESGFSAMNAIYVPALPSELHTTSTDVLLEDEEESTKLTYFTPRVSGFQAGVSYTNDIGDQGSAAGLSGESDANNFENVWNFGANYEGTFENVNVRIGATGEVGEAETTAQQDISAWQVGAEAELDGISLAGSYGDNGDSRQAVSTRDVTYWTAGVAYEHGHYAVSATYLDTEASEAAGDDTFTNLVLGAEYHLAPGLLPYVEAAFFDADEGGTGPSNSGNVIMVGTEIHF